MAEFSPNLKYDHVFAVVRVDELCGVDRDPEQSITVKKIVSTSEQAEAEVERLNRLAEGKGARYFWQVTRIERAVTARQA